MSNPSYQRLFGKALRQLARRAACLRLLTGLVLFTGLSISSPVAAATLPTGFTETLVASGLSAPTAMAFAPDGRLFVCQQGGQLRVIKNGVLLGPPFVTVTTTANGERGLLGIAFDPNFAVNQFVYVYYTAATPAIHNRVSRFTASGDVAAGGETIIFDLNNLTGATNHNGGAIHFGPDGKLYIDVGENANPANSQSIGNLLGKVLRINSDGTIPSDNPTTFPGIAGSPTGNNRAIWAVGLRNPYTFTFQPGTGRMFINDVGQSTWEEINDGIAGSNYGWSICEGFCAPANANFRDPLFEYGHGSSATTGCAITGGAFYNPTTATFPSDYVGKYFFAEFCTGWIRRFDPGTGTSVAFASGISSPVDLIVTNDGSLYYLANGSGSVFRVQFSNPTASNGIVSGRLTTGGGAPVEGAVVSLTGSQTRKTVTDTNGNYYFDDVETNGFYTVVPTRANFAFSPSQRAFSQLGQHTEAAFNATPTGNALNPLDTTEYFVRQQYVDFFGREPDESGLNFWVNNIESCGADQTCHEAKRNDTSAAFFLSIEFQQTGYLVYRMYRSAYGDMPGMPVPLRLAEFMPDSAEISNGVVVLKSGWETVLENNKQAFTAEFVQRSRFTTAFPLSMSLEDFVDRLNSNAGNPLSRSERDQLINSGMARAQILRTIAEHPNLVNSESNRAFVVMQYFGYLRRNPDDPPEATLDFQGYNFWLSKLNEFNGNFQDAEMVKAFLVSSEYRRRFPR